MRYSIKKMLFLKVLQNSQKNTCVGVSFNKVADEIFQNTFFIEHLRATASVKVPPTLCINARSKPTITTLWALL